MFLKIISGGQTGVDRAALDVALERHLPCGGWCPRGRLAEDGRIPDHYPLDETAGASYPERTRKNILAADATLVLAEGGPTGGTKLTVNLCHDAGKPWHLLDLWGADSLVVEMAGWVAEHVPAGGTLNVAGSRESKCPGIYGRAVTFLRRLLDALDAEAL